VNAGNYFLLPAGSTTLPKMMKALIKRDAQSSYELVEIPVPKPKEDEILIKNEKVSICGSDIPLYKWDETGKKIAKLPFTPGHEMFGTVCSYL